jgi:prepilin-type N-terminal cleavage/methylation domain-containing protein
MNPRSEQGFSLIELLVATIVLLIVMGVVMTALRQSSQQQQTIWNRTEMHSGVRGATELLQQEVGQAGRVATPTPITLSAAVTKSVTCDESHPDLNVSTVAVNSVSGLWATAGATPASYALVTTFDGSNRETVPLWSITAGPPAQISACFSFDHAAGTVLVVQGTFGNGIIPPAPGVCPSPACTLAGFPGVPNGSTGTVLKMFGDINGDGNMVYVEYTCDTATATPANPGKLYRNAMAFDATFKKPLPDPSLVLLGNILQNPGGTPCFTYQVTAPITIQGQPLSFVLDVAITLTVETQQVDPITKLKQQETKALLNVSPRNVFNAWELAGVGFTDRIQSTPASVSLLTGM